MTAKQLIGMIVMAERVNGANGPAAGVHICNPDEKRVVKRLEAKGLVRVERPGSRCAGMEEWFVYRGTGVEFDEHRR